MHLLKLLHPPPFIHGSQGHSTHKRKKRHLLALKATPLSSILSRSLSLFPLLSSELKVLLPLCHYLRMLGFCLCQEMLSKKKIFLRLQAGGQKKIKKIQRIQLWEFILATHLQGEVAKKIAWRSRNENVVSENVGGEAAMR